VGSEDPGNNRERPPLRQRPINATFARLWRAMLLSSVGDWIGVVAVSVLVARMGGPAGGGFAVAGVMAARLVALVVLGPVAGVVVDRYDRKGLMVAADVGRAIAYGVLPFAGLAGIVVLSFGIEALSLVWGPSLDATIPGIVEDDDLPRANAVNVLTSYGTLPLGAAVFSVLAAVAAGHSAGPLGSAPEAWALWLDAASFLVSAVVIARLRFPARPIRHLAVGRPRRDWRAELTFLSDHPEVRRVIVVLVIALAGAGAVVGVGPVFTAYSLGVETAGYGVLVTCVGLGFALGAGQFLSRRGAARTGPQPRLAPPMVVLGAGLVLMSLTRSMVVAGAVGAVLGVAGGWTWVVGYTGLQRSVSDEFRGRTFALLTVAGRSALLVARVVFPLAAGIIGVTAGPRVALAGAGVLVVVASGTAARGRPGRRLGPGGPVGPAGPVGPSH
jgi:dTMP kinase